MSIIVSDCQHCDEQQFHALSCVAFFSSKIRIIHTSTVTGSDSCSGKNTCTLRVHLVIIIGILISIEVHKCSNSNIMTRYHLMELIALKVNNN